MPYTESYEFFGGLPTAVGKSEKKSSALGCYLRPRFFYGIGMMKRERIKLSEHFNYRKLLRFTLPSVVMAVFTSVYSIVDGVFVSKAVGDTAFAGLNIIFPYIMILGAIGMMLGSGGSALVSKTLGEGDEKRANGYFSFLVIAVAVAGVVFGGAGIAALRPVAELLGANATPETVDQAEFYGFICLLGMPFLMLQYSFQSFMITAEKSTLGFLVTVAAGVTNALFDAVFILGFRWGLAGAASATLVGQAIGGIVPVIYFARKKNDSLLHLIKPKCEFKSFIRACTNGASELLSNVSFSVVSILYNRELLKIAEDNGVIAYGIIMYMSTIFFNTFFGFSMGAAPIVGYHYGAQNKEELRNLKRMGFVVCTVLGVALTVLAEGLASPFARIFATSEEVFVMTRHGVHLYSPCYLLMGFSVFGSAFFTALNNGLVSGAISCLRSLLFQCGAVLLMARFAGLDGIWLAATAAEALSFLMTGTFFIVMRKKYGYGGKTVDRKEENVIE